MLAPAGDRFDDATRARLSAALHLVVGIDAIVVLTDVAGLNRDEVLDVLGWVATTLVDAALQSSSHPGRPEDGGAVTG